MQAFFKKNLRGVIFPLLAAFIWGISFPMQEIAIQYMDAFYINGFRSLIAAAILFFICLFLKKIKKKNLGKTKDVIKGSLACGICLFFAVNLQQIGIVDTGAGKTGFITALYTVLVPIFGLFIGKKVGLKTWISVAIAVVGLFLICVKSGFQIQLSDLLVMGCAVFFALQIMAIDFYIDKVNGFALSCGQFLVTGVLSLIVAFFTSDIGEQDFIGALPSLLYVAICSSCIAYTLQILSFGHGNPTVLSLLFSTEAVFAVLTSAIILGETLTAREYIGCAVMFAAVLLAEVPLSRQSFIKVRGSIKKKFRKTEE